MWDLHSTSADLRRCLTWRAGPNRPDPVAGNQDAGLRRQWLVPRHETSVASYDGRRAHQPPLAVAADGRCVRGLFRGIVAAATRASGRVMGVGVVRRSGATDWSGEQWSGDGGRAGRRLDRGHLSGKLT